MWADFPRLPRRQVGSPRRKPETLLCLGSRRMRRTHRAVPLIGENVCSTDDLAHAKNSKLRRGW
jgi:hypothetical protein